MRTVGEIAHKDYKITLLHHNAKYTLQIEGDMVTQSYKFRETESINGIAYFDKLLQESNLLENIVKTNKQLLSNHRDMLVQKEDDYIFEEII